MRNAPSHIFVYGTLRADSDHPMARRLRAHATLVGKGRAKGRLYDLGWYPAATFDENETRSILGDVFAMTPGERLLVELDAYEAGNPSYVRCALEVRFDDGSRVLAWAYGMVEPPNGRLIPGGDFLTHWRSKRRRRKDP